MSSNLVISTPRPSLAPNAYTHSGRGGAGNTYRVSSKEPSQPSSTTASSSSSSSKPRRFYSGVGGAGNVHAADERPPPGLNLDEEIARARARERSGYVRSGIGGAGNIFRKGKKEEAEEAVVGEKERRGSQWSLSSWESVLKPNRS